MATIYDCYEGRRLVASGTLEQISRETGLAMSTVKNLAWGNQSSRYDIYRRPPRDRDIFAMFKRGII